VSGEIVPRCGDLPREEAGQRAPRPPTKHAQASRLARGAGALERRVKLLRRGADTDPSLAADGES
jgi:hypothetical protein